MNLLRRLVCAVRGHRGRRVFVNWTLDAFLFAMPTQVNIVWHVCERCGELYGRAEKP